MAKKRRATPRRPPPRKSARVRAQMRNPAAAGPSASPEPVTVISSTSENSDETFVSADEGMSSDGDTREAPISDRRQIWEPLAVLYPLRLPPPESAAQVEEGEEAGGEEEKATPDLMPSPLPDDAHRARSSAAATPESHEETAVPFPTVSNEAREHHAPPPAESEEEAREHHAPTPTEPVRDTSELRPAQDSYRTTTFFTEAQEEATEVPTLSATLCRRRSSRRSSHQPVREPEQELEISDQEAGEEEERPDSIIDSQPVG